MSNELLRREAISVDCRHSLWVACCLCGGALARYCLADIPPRMAALSLDDRALWEGDYSAQARTIPLTDWLFPCRPEKN